MKIERVVKKRLTEMGKTQTWLGERIGVSRQGVSQFLKGTSGMSMAKFTKMLTVLKLEIQPKGERR